MAEREANDTALALACTGTVNMLNNLNDDVSKQTHPSKHRQIFSHPINI